MSTGKKMLASLIALTIMAGVLYVVFTVIEPKPYDKAKNEEAMAAQKDVYPDAPEKMQIATYPYYENTFVNGPFYDALVFNLKYKYAWGEDGVIYAMPKKELKKKLYNEGGDEGSNLDYIETCIETIMSQLTSGYDRFSFLDYTGYWHFCDSYNGEEFPDGGYISAFEGAFTGEEQSKFNRGRYLTNPIKKLGLKLDIKNANVTKLVSCQECWDGDWPCYIAEVNMDITTKKESKRFLDSEWCQEWIPKVGETRNETLYVEFGYYNVSWGEGAEPLKNTCGVWIVDIYHQK